MPHHRHQAVLPVPPHPQGPQLVGSRLWGRKLPTLGTTPQRIWDSLSLPWPKCRNVRTEEWNWVGIHLFDQAGGRFKQDAAQATALVHVLYVMQFNSQAGRRRRLDAEK